MLGGYTGQKINFQQRHIRFQETWTLWWKLSRVTISCFCELWIPTRTHVFDIFFEWLCCSLVILIRRFSWSHTVMFDHRTGSMKYVSSEMAWNSTHHKWVQSQKSAISNLLKKVYTALSCVMWIEFSSISRHKAWNLLLYILKSKSLPCRPTLLNFCCRN